MISIRDTKDETDSVLFHFCWCQAKLSFFFKVRIVVPIEKMSCPDLFFQCEPMLLSDATLTEPEN